MAYLSLFTVLRPGPGPSSVHTAGPWLAARRFVHELAASQRARSTLSRPATISPSATLPRPTHAVPPYNSTARRATEGS